jgi:hypothetical protein
MVDAESKLQLEFSRWTVSNAKQIEAIAKDEECKAHITDPNYCDTIMAACDLTCSNGETSEEATRGCIPTPGGGSVHESNHNFTWTVDGYSDAGHMQGFRYIEDPEVLGMFSKYQRQAWQQCASDRNSTASKTKDLRETHQKRVAEISKVMSRHFPKATSYLYSENFKEAKELGSETRAVKELRESALTKQVEAAVRRAMEGQQGGTEAKKDLSTLFEGDIVEALKAPVVTHVDIVPKDSNEHLISLRASLLEAFYNADKEYNTAQSATVQEGLALKWRKKALEALVRRLGR